MRSHLTDASKAEITVNNFLYQKLQLHFSFMGWINDWIWVGLIKYAFRVWTVLKLQKNQLKSPA